MKKIKDIYCRMIRWLFLKSHSVSITIYRKDAKPNITSFIKSPIVIDDGIEAVSISMVPNHHRTGS